MFKKNIIVITSVGIMLIMALPAFAQQTGGATGATLTTSTVPATTGSMPSTGSASKIACVGAAVNTREQALITGVTTYGQSVNVAYSARAAALAQAYTQTGGNGVIKTATKAAWSTFTASTKSARAGWTTARKAAWSQFVSDAKACKAPASVSDSGNSSSEVSGK